MLALFSAPSFSSFAPAFAASAPPRLTASRAGVIIANQNEMEPEDGWNVDNLIGMMDDAEESIGGPTVAETFDKLDIQTMPGITAPLGFFDPLNFCGGASEG